MSNALTPKEFYEVHQDCGGFEGVVTQRTFVVFVMEGDVFQPSWEDGENLIEVDTEYVRCITHPELIFEEVSS